MQLIKRGPPTSPCLAISATLGFNNPTRQMFFLQNESRCHSRQRSPKSYMNLSLKSFFKDFRHFPSPFPDHQSTSSVPGLSYDETKDKCHVNITSGQHRSPEEMKRKQTRGGEVDLSSPTSRKKRGDTEDSDNSSDFGMNFALGSLKRKRALLDQDLGQASEDTPACRDQEMFVNQWRPEQTRANFRCSESQI